jgi:hypothetical protein
VFVGAHGTTMSGNNSMALSVENNSNAYAITVDGELTNTTPIKLTPYSTTDFTVDYAVIKGTTDATKFTLNTENTQHLEADAENNCLVVKAGDTTGIDDVNVAADVAPVYYNLSGLKVANPANGLYIVRRGNTVTKEYVK